jgi:hypothetical protein
VMRRGRGRRGNWLKSRLAGSEGAPFPEPGPAEVPHAVAVSIGGGIIGHGRMDAVGGHHRFGPERLVARSRQGKRSRTQEPTGNRHLGPYHVPCGLCLYDRDPMLRPRSREASPAGAGTRPP